MRLLSLVWCMGVVLTLALVAPSCPVSAAPPAAGTRAATLPHVLFIRGLWSLPYRCEEALARSGGGLFDDCWVWDGAGSGWPGPGDQGAGGVMDFPAPAALAAYQSVVVVNVNAKAFGGNQKALADYVQNGGGVLFLGGRFAFGKEYRESAFAALCPVDFPGERQWGSDLVTVAAGVGLKPGPDVLGTGFSKLAWERAPLVFWYHEVKPKAGAKVLLSTADGKPLLVVGESGKGRVAVFAGTVMGDPQAGQLPFWDWDGWPQVEAVVLSWLAESATAHRPALGEAARNALTTAAGKADDLDSDTATSAKAGGAPVSALEAPLLAAAGQCGDAATLAFILEAVRGAGSDLTPASVSALAALWPLADAACVPVAEALLKSGMPYKTALGACLLGAAKAPGAEELLAPLVAKGEPVGAPKDDLGGGADLDKGADAGMGGGKLVLPAEQQQRQVMIKLNALAGLGLMGDARALPSLRDAVKRHAAGAPKPKAYVDVLTDDNRLYQQAVLAALCCGDEGAVGSVVDGLLENIYTIARARNEGNKTKDRLKKVHETLPAQLAWRQTLYAQLPTVPDSVLPAVARRLAAEKDRRIAEIALPLLAGRQLSPEVAAILKASPIPAVAALATP